MRLNVLRCRAGLLGTKRPVHCAAVELRQRDRDRAVELRQRDRDRQTETERHRDRQSGLVRFFKRKKQQLNVDK